METNFPVNRWSSEHNSVFRLIESGEYRRGAPIVTNEFYFLVQPGHGVSDDLQAQSVAERVARLLNRDDRLRKLEQNQAPGRTWMVVKINTGQYFSEEFFSWTSEDQATKYAAPFEAFQAIERLEKAARSLDLLEFEVLPFDDPALFKDPINHEGKPFVVLRGLVLGNKFYSCSSKGDNPIVMANGAVAYELVAYCDTSEEAQRILGYR